MNAPATWLRIAPDHPALAGHFPGDPIVPGALLLDEALHSIDPRSAHWRISSVKFHRIVRPAEALQLDWRRQAGGQLRLEVRAGEALVMSATLEAPAP
jgi:3-hydroxymyristoyl/3-hydroxydecanoyl-(acyl carrier protein) dehydratase